MEAIAGPQHGPLAEISPQSSRLSSPTRVAGWLNDMVQGESPEKDKVGPVEVVSNVKSTSRRQKRGSVVLDEEDHPTSKRNSVALDDDVSSMDSGAPVARDHDTDDRENTEVTAVEANTEHDSASDSGTTSVESASENRTSNTTKTEFSIKGKLPSTPNVKGRPTRVMSIDKFNTEAAIEQRMEELRYLYRQNLIQYRRITAEMGCMNDPPFHRPASRSKSLPSGTNGVNDVETSRRSRRNTALKSIGDSEFEQRAREDVLLSTSVSKPKAFSTKPTPEEIVIDGNGHKSYQCLLCPRKFTHPPAFSQHKRSHGREQAEAAARAAAAAASESSSSDASTP